MNTAAQFFWSHRREGRQGPSPAFWFAAAFLLFVAVGCDDDEDDDCATCPCPVVVDSVALSTGEITFTALGDTMTLTATAFDSDANALEDMTFSWVSSAESVATVTAAGLVTAQGNGTAQVMATAGCASDAATIIVTQAIDEILIEPPTATIIVGETALLVARAEDARDNPVEDAVFEWGSENGAIATVDTNGRVTGVSPGQVNIFGTVQEDTGTAVITVEPAGSLACGTLISDSITAAAEVDQFMFVGNTTDQVLLTLGEVGPFGTSSAHDARATVMAPSGGQVVVFDSDSQQMIELPESGIYVVNVNANNLTSTGRYNLGLECLIPIGANEGTLVLGDLAEDSISKVAEVDLFIFMGQELDVILLTLGEVGPLGTSSAHDARATLISPSGSQLTVIDSNAQQTISLPETGSYVIHVNANNLISTGRYNIGLEGLFPVSADAITLALGDLAMDSIKSVAEADLYTFPGQTGDVLVFTAGEIGAFGTSSAHDARVTVISPTGSQLVSLDSNSQQTVTLPESGDYVIYVNANNYLSTGKYNLGIEGLSPLSPGAVMVSCGDLASDSIVAVAEVDLFTHAGTEGEQRTITLAEDGPFGTSSAHDARATMIAPSGNQVLQMDSDGQQIFTLPESGSYVIYVNANNFISTGKYNLSFVCP